MTQAIHVAVGVILDQAGQALVARRPPGVHLAGLWEFPGGKVEAKESVLQALERELLEELGILIDIDACFPLKKIRYEYPEKTVLLDVWTVNRFSGTPRGREDQVLSWQPIEHLDPALFPPANRKIIDILKLPRILAITGQAATESDLLRKVEVILSRGVRLLQLRQPGIADDEFLVRAARVADLCESFAARLLLNTTPDTFSRSRAHGLHLSAERLMRCGSRPVAETRLFSAACHTLEELLHAQDIGADFVLLSPVNPTSSHPGAAVLGWDEFRRLAGSVNLPVFALGGLQPEDLQKSLSAGAYGIAAISALWPRATPARQ